jgi:hypothetical protein
MVSVESAVKDKTGASTLHGLEPTAASRMEYDEMLQRQLVGKESVDWTPQFRLIIELSDESESTCSLGSLSLS